MKKRLLAFLAMAMMLVVAVFPAPLQADDTPLPMSSGGGFQDEPLPSNDDPMTKPDTLVPMYPDTETQPTPDTSTGQVKNDTSTGQTVELHSDVPPVMVRGRTMVPVRVIADWLGLPTNYDSKSQSVSVGEMQFYEQKVGFDSSRRSLAYPVDIKLRTMNAKVKGVDKELEVPAITWKGRTIVPLRFVADSLSVTVTWDAATQTIFFDSNGRRASLVVPRQSAATTKALEAQVRPIIDEHNFMKAARNGPSYAELAKGSTRYLGKPAQIAGIVFQAIEKDNGSTVVLLQNGLNQVQLIAVLYDGPVDMVEGDRVTVYGRVHKPYTYITQGGLTRTIPAIELVVFEEGMGDVLEGLSLLGGY